MWNARAANGCTHLAAPCTSSLHVLSRPPARAASCDYFASRFIETIGKQVKCLYFTPGSHRYRICGFLTGLCLGYGVHLNRVDLRLLNLCDVKTRGYTFYYAVRIVQYAASVITRSSVRPSVCPFDRQQQHRQADLLLRSGAGSRYRSKGASAS